MNNPFDTIDARLINIENLLLDLKHAPKVAAIPQSPQEEYITRKDVAKKCHISLNTVDSYTKDGKFKGYRIGSRILYKSNEIDEALKLIRTTSIAA